VGGRPLKTTTEWQGLARIDPLFAVATWPEKQGRWTADEFYAVGRSDWADFRHHWSHYQPELGGTCVEIGCGAGRITHALATDFGRVVALDVSLEMIELAQAASPPNVEFRRVAGTEIPLADASVEAVFTCHVLQHLDSFDLVARYLGEAFRVLRPGGTVMVQLGLHSAPMRPWGRARQELRLRWGRLARRVGADDLTFRVRLYTREQLLDLFERLGFADIELRVFFVRSNGATHAFWLARRP
jgi:ubiquinone/menaquinone biosynthesis C-methylase UbiE